VVISSQEEEPQQPASCGNPLIDRIRSIYGDKERQRQEERVRQQKNDRDFIRNDPIERQLFDDVIDFYHLLTHLGCGRA
jgi:hypothetical protein